MADRSHPSTLPRRFVVLDGLRGVAAMCVVACHIPPLLGWSTASAGLAVDFFFCLSGFVIEHAYGERIAEPGGARRFAVARAARLYPLYLLGAIIGLVGAMAGLRFAGAALPPVTLAGVFALACLALPSAALVPLYALDPPAWSLACEAVANAVYALFPRALRTPRRLLAIALASFAVVVAMALHELTTDFGWRSDWTALGGIARVGFSFFIGVLLRRTIANRRIEGVNPWLLALVLLALLNVPDIGPTRIVYEFVFIALLSPAIILLGAGSRVEGPAERVFALSGAISYPVYVLHVPLYELVYVGAARRLGLDLSAFAPWSGLGFVAALVGIAWAADRAFDRPVRRLISRVSQRQQDPRDQPRPRVVELEAPAV